MNHSRVPRLGFCVVGFALIFATVALAPSCSRKLRDPMAVRDLTLCEGKSAFRISPSGELIAYLQSSDRRQSLLTVDLRSPESESSCVSGQENEFVTSFFWLDDRNLAFTSRCESGGPASVLCARLESSNSCNEYSVKILAGSSEGAELVGAIRRGGQSRVVLAVPSPTTSKAGKNLYVVDPVSGQRDLLHNDQDGVSAWYVSEDGSTVAGIRGKDDGGCELVVYHGSKNTVRLACQSGERMDVAGVSPNGAEIYLLTDRGEQNDLLRLEQISALSGASALLAEDPERKVDATTGLWSGDGKDLLAVAYARDRLDYKWHSVADERRMDAVRAQFPDRDVIVDGLSRDGSKWIITIVSDTHPPLPYLYDHKLGRASSLADAQLQHQNGQFGSMQPFRYTARDGAIVTGYLTLPPEQLRQSPSPLVVFPHGGPAMRSFWGFDPRVQFLATRGYMVFQPNFRGSSGFGKKYRNAGNGQWGRGVMQHDITDGVDYLVEEGLVDRSRIAIFGGSYGGYAALAGVAFEPDLFAAGICLFGASDLNKFIRELPNSWKEFIGNLYDQIGDPDNENDARRMWWQSPLNYAQNITAPVLLFHGANDPIIRVSQSENFVRTCRANGKDVDFLVSDNGAHGFDDPLDEQAVYVGIERFLADHLGGRVSHIVPTTVEERLQNLRSSGNSRVSQ